MSERRMRTWLACTAIGLAVALPPPADAAPEASTGSCAPAFSEHDVAQGLVIEADCGLPARVLQRLVDEPNRAVYRARLASNQRAAFARAANIMLAAIPPDAFGNVGAVLAALVATARRRPDVDFVAVASQWSTRYQRLLRMTSVTRTSDPTELDIDRAIGRLQLGAAAKLLAVQLNEPKMPPALAAMRHYQAAIVEWLRFAPERALGYANAAHALQPDDVELAETYADMLDDLNRFDQAEPLYELLLVRYESLAQDRAELWRPRMAQLLVKLGRLYAALQATKDAEMAYLRALDVYWGLARNDPVAYGPPVATTFGDLGLLYRDMARPGDAVEVYREQLKLERALALRDRTAYEPEVATTLNDLGVLYEMLHRNDDADSAYVEALAIQRRLADDNPAVYRPVLARTLSNFGNLYSGMGKRHAAHVAYGEALQIRRQLASESFTLNGADVARTLTNLGALYRVEGRSAQAQRAYDEALRIYRALGRGAPGAYRLDQARTLNNLGVLYSRTNRPREAENAYRRSVALYDRLSKADAAAHRGDYARVLSNLAQLYLQTGRPREADAAKLKASRMLEAAGEQ
jgi:tetratricopeptide (TPR) repeat protein